MSALNDRFWAKVLFSQFIKHFRKMNDTEIVADIKQSMDDLEDLNDEGDSFGAKMVKWSMERAEQPFAQAARENGRRGGRPRNDGKGPMPEDVQEVYDYASLEGLDTDDAYECWHVTVNERNGLTADGREIKNWKAYVKQWCRTRKSKREENGHGNKKD